jgi:ATPase subunit of ABC transporter with duplicated ATPase domains
MKIQTNKRILTEKMKKNKMMKMMTKMKMKRKKKKRRKKMKMKRNLMKMKRKRKKMKKRMRRAMRSLFKSKSSKTTIKLINLNNISKRATNNVRTKASIKINKISKRATSTVEAKATSTVEVKATSTVEEKATSKKANNSTVVDLYTQSFVFFSSHFFQNEFVPLDTFFFFLRHLGQILVFGFVKSKLHNLLVQNGDVLHMGKESVILNLWFQVEINREENFFFRVQHLLVETKALHFTEI